MYEKSADQSARYCEETERMARYMQQLNAVYERMIQAMTMNMHHPMMSPADMAGVGNRRRQRIQGTVGARQSPETRSIRWQQAAADLHHARR